MVSSSKISELESALEEARAETQETKERMKVLQVTDVLVIACSGVW